MPSSLTRVLSRALGFSPYLPVSVYGTGGSSAPHAAFLGSMESASSRGRSHFLITSRCWTCVCGCRLLHIPPTGLNRIPLPDGISFFVPACFNASRAGAGILTCLPSTTPFGLVLGPDLPWEDEPGPGNLRFSARRILTSFVATHACIFSSMNSTCPCRSRFSAHGMLLYHSAESAASVFSLAPLYLRRRFT